MISPDGNESSSHFSHEADPNVVRALLERHRNLYLAEFESVYVLGDRSLALPRSAYLTRTFQDLRCIRAAEIRQLGSKGRLPNTQGLQFDLKHRSMREAQLIARLRRPRQRALILGDAGNGKTEFTRNLAYVHARDMFARDPTPFVPLRVELKNLNIANDSQGGESESAPLLEQLRQVSEPLCTHVEGVALFDQLAGAGQLILILDGLDEIADPDARTHFDHMLLHAARQGALRDCPLVLTARTNAVSNEIAALADVAFHYQPRPLQLYEMQHYVRVHFAVNGGVLQRAEDLVQAIRAAASGVRDLLGWPLMLALACVRSTHGDSTLPITPAEFMQAALLELLQRRAPKGGVSEWAGRALDDLARLAADSCPGFENVPFDRACEAVSQPGRVDELVERSGILFGTPSRGYHFSNRPIAEYLAGRAMARQGAEHVCRCFGDHIWDDRWEQPLFWMAGDLWHDRSRRSLAAQLLGRIQDERARGCDDLLKTLFKRCVMWLSAAPNDATYDSDGPTCALVEELVELNAGRLAAMGSELRSLPLAVRNRLADSWLPRLHSLVSSPNAPSSIAWIPAERVMDTLIEWLDPKQNPDKCLREVIASALGEIGSERAAEPLLGTLDPAWEPREAPRYAAARALGTLAPERAVAALLPRLDVEYEPVEWLRLDAVESLYHVGSELCADALAARLDPNCEPESSVRTEAAFVLSCVCPDRANDALLRAINPTREPDASVRRAATVALGRIGSNRAVAPLLDALVSGHESDVNVRGAAVTALGEIGSEQVVDALIERLNPTREPFPEIRAAAVLALNEIGGPRAIDALIEQLDGEREPSRSVRRVVAETLAAHGCERAVNVVLERINPNRRVHFRELRKVANVLRRGCPERLVDALLARLDVRREPDASVRREAVRHLGWIRSERAVSNLIGGLAPANEPEVMVREKVATALGDIGSERAIDAMLRAGWIFDAAHLYRLRGRHVFVDTSDSICDQGGAHVVAILADESPTDSGSGPLPRKRFTIAEVSRLRIDCSDVVASIARSRRRHRDRRG